MSQGQHNLRWHLITAILAIGSILAGLAIMVSLCFAQATSAPQPPDVSIQVIPVRDSLERGESAPLNIIISNGSNVTLSNVKVLVTPNNLVTEYDPAIADVPPFGTAHLVLTVMPGDRAPFVANTLMVEVQYTWRSGDAEFRSSAMNTTASITVKRRFADELGGLLEGGAAALYFLLPILPAIAAYQFVDQLRSGKAVTFTSFSVANFVPGLAGSVLANVIVYHFVGAVDILDPTTFFKVFGVSLLVGAAIPSIRWVRSKYEWWRWGFHEDDSPEDFLRKSLSGPYSERHRRGYYDLVTLVAGTEKTPDSSARDTWTGMLMFTDKRKDKDIYFLGKSLYVAIADDKWRDQITNDVIDLTGAVFNRKKIIQAVMEKKLTIQPHRLIVHGQGTESALVSVVDGEYTQEVKAKERIVKMI